MAGAQRDGQTSRRGPRDRAAVRELSQMVVIDLRRRRERQEIFEALNARGAHCHGRRLIKNFVFQRLTRRSGVDRRAVLRAALEGVRDRVLGGGNQCRACAHARSSMFQSLLVVQRWRGGGGPRGLHSVQEFCDVRRREGHGRPSRGRSTGAAGIYREFTERSSKLTGPIYRPAYSVIALVSWRAMSSNHSSFTCSILRSSQ